MLARPGLARPGQTIIADKGYGRASFHKTLNGAGITLIRPATKTERPRPGRRFLRPFRQIIESVNNTLKTQLDLERHGGRTKAGVIARILQRLLALINQRRRLGPSANYWQEWAVLGAELFAPLRPERNKSYGLFGSVTECHCGLTALLVASHLAEKEPPP